MASAALLVENEVLEELYCNICCELPKKKVFQCKNGHSLCGKCHHNRRVCPHCRGVFDKEYPIRNLFFEEVLQRRTRKLPNLDKSRCVEAPEDYDCPICFNLPEQEVFQCKNGHPLCATCHQRLKFCPQCKRPFDKNNPIRNLVFEKLVDKFVVVNCTYKINGCDHRPTRKFVQDHVSKCHFNIDRFGKLINLCKLLGYEGCDFCVNNGNTEDAVKHFIFHHGCVTTEANHFQMELAGFHEVTNASSDKIFLWTPVISDLKEKNCFLLTSAILIFHQKVIWLSCFSIFLPKFNESLADLKIEYSVTGKNVDSLEWKRSQSCILLSKVEAFFPNKLTCSILPPNLNPKCTSDGNLVINCLLLEDVRNNSNQETYSRTERILCAKRTTPSNFLPSFYLERQEVVTDHAQISLIKNVDICVKNLPDFATKEYIKNFFSEFGKVISVKVIPQTKSTGQGNVSKSCTVSFEHRISVHKVIQKEPIRLKKSGKKYRLDITAERLTMNTKSEANSYTDKAEEAGKINRDALMEYILEAFSSTGDSDVKERLTFSITFRAAKFGSLESLKYCIEKGIDVNLNEHSPAENSNHSLLSRTICDENPKSGLEKAKYLVENGADIHFKDKLGGTLLHHSVLYSTVEMVKFLLDKGLDVNACNTVGWTALHSVFLADMEIRSLLEKVKILLDYGASLFIKNKEGQSPLTLIREAPVQHREKIEEMFRNHLKRVRNLN